MWSCFAITFFSVEVMFRALSDCQILHPDPEEQDEGNPFEIYVRSNAKESFGLHPNIKGQYRVLWISRASKVCTRVNDHRMNQGVFSHVSRLEYSSVPVCIQDSGGSRGGAQEDLLPPLSFGPKPRTAGPRHQLGCPLIFRSWSASDCTIRFGLLEQLGIRILLK